ncbi:MAG: hypothetical protein M1820_010736, partial [Bogoriella megaspora]
MVQTRRSSARLRKRSTTPKFPGSFPDDEAAPQSNLGSLEEAEEPVEVVATPGASSTVPLNDEPKPQETPKQNTPMRPSSDEMHPEHHHSTTTKPLDDARWLGFMPKGAATEPIRPGSKIPAIQNT